MAQTAGLHIVNVGCSVVVHVPLRGSACWMLRGSHWSGLLADRQGSRGLDDDGNEDDGVSFWQFGILSFWHRRQNDKTNETRLLECQGRDRADAEPCSAEGEVNWRSPVGLRKRKENRLPPFSWISYFVAHSAHYPHGAVFRVGLSPYRADLGKSCAK